VVQEVEIGSEGESLGHDLSVETAVSTSQVVDGERDRTDPVDPTPTQSPAIDGSLDEAAAGEIESGHIVEPTTREPGVGHHPARLGPLTSRNYPRRDHRRRLAGR